MVAISCLFYILDYLPHSNSMFKMFLIAYTGMSCIVYALIRTVHSELYPGNKQFRAKWNILLLILLLMAAWIYWKSGVETSMKQSVERIFWDQKYTIKALSSPDVDIRKNTAVIWTYEFYPDVPAATLFLSDVARNFKKEYNKRENYILSMPWHKSDFNALHDLKVLETTIEEMVRYRKDIAEGRRPNGLDYVSIKEPK
jgi:hypothetical protein